MVAQERRCYVLQLHVATRHQRAIDARRRRHVAVVVEAIPSVGTLAFSSPRQRRNTRCGCASRLRVAVTRARSCQSFVCRGCAITLRLRLRVAVALTRPRRDLDAINARRRRHIAIVVEAIPSVGTLDAANDASIDTHAHMMSWLRFDIASVVARCRLRLRETSSPTLGVWLTPQNLPLWEPLLALRRARHCQSCDGSDALL